MRRGQPLVTSAVLAVLLGGLGTGTAHADTGTALYVDDAAAGCSDTGPGSQAEPFCQIQPAAQAAAPGETVHIASNITAYAPVTIAATGTADAPITFIAAPGNGTAVTVLGQKTAAITFSGAQYVDMAGIYASAGGATALAVADSQHITYRVATVRTGATTATTPVIAVDGSSSDIALTRDLVLTTTGLGFASAAGAQNITLADDHFNWDVGGGIAAVGTTGIHLAGDTISTLCGNAISLTGGTSGSVENTVAMPGGTTYCSDTGTPAEITVDAASAGQVTEDYNAVNPLSSGTDYEWAGTSYATSQALQAGTGQGAHDLDQTDLTIPVQGWLTEHSPLIDSADAGAPGELSTDYYGNPRVDDPLVADTGTGDSSYDRGAMEFQDPFTVSWVDMSPSYTAYVGVPTTFTAKASNPWSDSLDGASYAFDFGDGTTATSTTGSATHTYTQDSGNGSLQTAVAVDRADGTRMGTGGFVGFTVTQPPGPDAGLSCGQDPSEPRTASCAFTATGYYQMTSDRITFGDGSAAVTVTGSSGSTAHTYAAAGTYTVTQHITDSDGRTATATTKVTVGPSYVVTSPKRILDTRHGTGAPQRPVGPGGVVRLKVLGVGGIPTSGVTAVTMNVTDADATASSYVTVYPDGTSRPTASNLNFTAGRVNPNLVTVRVGSDGYVDLYNAHGDVDIIADVEGYFTSVPRTGAHLSGLYPLTTPERDLDTRYGTGAPKGKVAPGSTTTVTLPRVASPAVAAVLDITATGGTSGGVVTVYCGSRPSTSNLNYRAGQTVSNLVVTPVCSGKIEIYNSGGHANLIADLQGLYYTTGGHAFVPTRPTRFLDTRNGTGAPAEPLGADGTLTVKVAGVDGVPAGAGAVLVNLTGVAPTIATHLTAYGDGSLPNVYNDNLAAGETRPVLAVLPVGADGCIRINNAQGAVNVIADLEGYSG